jgi:hypothetical protein
MCLQCQMPVTMTQTIQRRVSEAILHGGLPDPNDLKLLSACKDAVPEAAAEVLNETWMKSSDFKTPINYRLLAKCLRAAGGVR